MSLTKYLKEVMQGKDLSYEVACEVSTQLMQSDLEAVQVAGLLAALKTKGETYEEISGFAKGLKNHAVTIPTQKDGFYDIVGTGGDGADTFNISTTCAFVLSGSGLDIAKHGNRSVSSKCGSADVLEALGVNIEATADNISIQLDEAGIAFIYAPLAHPSMKRVMPVRRQLGVPTIFNIIGPLANPVELSGQLVGVYKQELVVDMAQSLIRLGVEKGAVVHGAGGLDEATLMGENTVLFIKNGGLKLQKIKGADYGLMMSELADIRGGDAAFNAEIVRSVLKGEKGARRDTVLLNAGIAFYAFDRAVSIEDGILMAAESIDSGRAFEQLEKLVRISNR
ncbi:MAG: anthranilate phosphoribosyltransferase [Clostridia bacterium]|nr:anthranilate phosphoribosyltransferase [Clostridia bacterium]